MDRTRFKAVEAGSDVGGTWYWNKYAGGACDVESHVYLPLLERTGFVSSKKYVNHEKISSYERVMAQKLNVYDRIEFNLHRVCCIAGGDPELAHDRSPGQG